MKNTSKQNNSKTNTFKSLKRQYRQACFILGKIKENKKSGKVHSQDIKGESRLRNIIEEYENYIKNKRICNRSPVEEPKTLFESPDQLSLCLVNKDFTKAGIVNKLWNQVEFKLSNMIINYITNNHNKLPTLPCYDSSDMFQGYHVIKCKDTFSKGLIQKFLNDINHLWMDLQLQFVAIKNMPQRPYGSISIPNTYTLSNFELLQYLQLHNPSIPINDWQVDRVVGLTNKQNCYILLITEASVVALRRVHNKLNFGINTLKIEINGDS